MDQSISAKRSQNMARIRGKDTRPEIALRRALWKLGLRYRLHRRIVEVRPDIVFVSARVAVFVDGCFWHGCPEHYTRPRSESSEFWATKLRANVARDKAQTASLMSAGWTVLRLWEHEVKNDLCSAAANVSAVVRGAKTHSPGRWVVFKVVEASADPSHELWHIEHSLSGAKQVIERPRAWKRPPTSRTNLDR